MLATISLRSITFKGLPWKKNYNGNIFITNIQDLGVVERIR